MSAAPSGYGPSLLSGCALPELVSRLTAAAPTATVAVQAWTENYLEDLQIGHVDTVITVTGLGVHPSVRSETILSDRFACVVAEGHPLQAQRVSLAQYLKCRHRRCRNGRSTDAGGPLAGRALLATRNRAFDSIILSRPGRGRASDTILTVPRRLLSHVAGSTPIRVLSAPREIRGFRYDMMWHPRLDDHPAHRWFRQFGARRWCRRA